jgi:hypothetical protein
MATFSLVYSDDTHGSARRIEFEAVDANGALRIAQSQVVGRTAELWEGDRKLCTLRRVGPDGSIWEVGPCANGKQLTSQHASPSLARAERERLSASSLTAVST